MSNGYLLTAGGWKKLKNEAVSNENFKNAARMSAESDIILTIMVWQSRQDVSMQNVSMDISMPVYTRM